MNDCTTLFHLHASLVQKTKLGLSTQHICTLHGHVALLAVDKDRTQTFTCLYVLGKFQFCTLVSR